MSENVREQYYARICWNTNGWTHPSGAASKLETNTFAAENGFGHEEWLFNFVWSFRGFQYAFLEGVNSSRKKVSGKTIDVLLWTITPQKQHVQIGEIRNCEVLTELEANKAYEHYEKKGWLKQMKEDVAKIDGKEDLSRNFMFNIRFRLENENVSIFEPRLVAEPTDRIAKLKRYDLVAVNDQLEVEKQWKTRLRTGSKEIPAAQTYFSPGWQGGTVDQHERRLQAALMKLLKHEFGKDNVTNEDNWVDLKVTHGHRKMFIETKIAGSAKIAIRQALGQILEYAFLRPSTQTSVVELFIVAPASPDKETSTYLELLRTKFHLPIQYCQFSLVSPLPQELKSS